MGINNFEYDFCNHTTNNKSLKNNFSFYSLCSHFSHSSHVNLGSDKIKALLKRICLMKSNHINDYE